MGTNSYNIYSDRIILPNGFSILVNNNQHSFTSMLILYLIYTDQGILFGLQKLINCNRVHFLWQNSINARCGYRVSKHWRSAERFPVINGVSPLITGNRPTLSGCGL